MKKSDIKDLTDKIIKFRNDRKWKQFHRPKDVAISLSLEASEVLEHFQWKTEEEVAAYLKTNKSHIGEELADVLYYVFLLSHDLKIDVGSALRDKLEKNNKKYPVSKARGNHTKYNQL